MRFITSVLITLLFCTNGFCIDDIFITKEYFSVAKTVRPPAVREVYTTYQAPVQSYAQAYRNAVAQTAATGVNTIVCKGCDELTVQAAQARAAAEGKNFVWLPSTDTSSIPCGECEITSFNGQLFYYDRVTNSVIIPQNKQYLMNTTPTYTQPQSQVRMYNGLPVFNNETEARAYFSGNQPQTYVPQLRPTTVYQQSYRYNSVQPVIECGPNGCYLRGG